MRKKMRGERLGLFQLPYLELLEAVLIAFDIAGDVVLTPGQREIVVLTYGRAIKEAVALKKEEYDEFRRKEKAVREAARNVDGSGIVGG